MSIDLRGLPRRTLPAGTELYRLHRAEHPAWHFSSTGSGRFDPMAATDLGAAYWAEEPLAAWVERFRTRRLLLEDDLAGVALSVITMPSSLTVYDLTRRTALTAGVTAALTAGADYAEAQALASRIAPSRRGIRWRVRHDPAAELFGVAVFGRVAPQPEAWPPEPRTSPLPTDLIESAEREFGYRVLPRPARAQSRAP